MRIISLNLKELFEKGQYQKILDLLTQLEEQGKQSKILLEWVICAYYHSRALKRLKHFEDAL